MYLCDMIELNELKQADWDNLVFGRKYSVSFDDEPTILEFIQGNSNHGKAFRHISGPKYPNTQANGIAVLNINHIPIFELPN